MYIMQPYCMHVESAHAGGGVRVGSVVGLVRVVSIVSDVGGGGPAMMHSFSRILSSLSQTFPMLMFNCPILILMLPILILMLLTTSIRVINWLKMLITCRMRMSMLFTTCPMLFTCETSISVPVKGNKEYHAIVVAKHCAHILLTIAAGIFPSNLSEGCCC